MERHVSLGRDYPEAPHIDQIFEEGTKAKYDFYAIPIVHPHPRPGERKYDARNETKTRMKSAFW